MTPEPTEWERESIHSQYCPPISEKETIETLRGMLDAQEGRHQLAIAMITKDRDEWKQAAEGNLLGTLADVKRLRAEIATLNANYLKVMVERDKARHELIVLHAREHLTCGWCNDMMHAPPGFTPPMTTEKMKLAVRIHMLDCPKHPIRETERDHEELREQVRLTIMENLHLADGDNCTLKRLKDAIGFELSPETES